MLSLNRVLVIVGAALAVTGAALFRSPVPQYGAVPTETMTTTSAPVLVPHPHDASSAQPSIDDVRQPLRLTVPSIGVSAAIIPAGVRTDGSLMLPPPDQIGWWIGGAEAGATRGNTVLAGHVDAADGSHGAFYNLSALQSGAKVALTTTSGTLTYRVVALRTYSRLELPPSLFARTGPHRLILVTCGGPYEDGYTRNLVVYALPTTD